MSDFIVETIVSQCVETPSHQGIFSISKSCVTQVTMVVAQRLRQPAAQVSTAVSHWTPGNVIQVTQAVMKDRVSVSKCCWPDTPRGIHRRCWPKTKALSFAGQKGQLG